MAFPALSVCREFSADRVNLIVNHPDVRPWVGAPEMGLVDVSPLVANLSNVLLMGAGGGVLFQCIETGLYEAHTQFLPEARGNGAVTVVRDALRWMFTRSDAVEIVTKVPEGNSGALGLVRAIHGQRLFERKAAWLTPTGPVSVAYYSLPIMAWAEKPKGWRNLASGFMANSRPQKPRRPALRRFTMTMKRTTDTSERRSK